MSSSSTATSGTQPKPLTTANSMVEGPREKPPQLYNPFNRKEAAPLDPEDFMGQAKFKYDDFLETRTMPRRNVHGRSEDQFDVEQARPTEKYLSKLQKHNFLDDVEEDPRIMDERGVAHFDQPPEVLAQLRADFRNPKFLAVLKRRTTRAGVSAEGDTRSTADSQTTSAEAAVRMPMARPARDTADASNPDFFTSAGQFDGFNAHREARRREYEAAKVIRDLVENDPDGIALLVPEIIDDPPPPPPPSSMVDGGSTLLTKAQAAKLLDVNPLRMLRLNARSDLMQLPDANAVYRLLQPIVLQHEEHRRHFNIVELVREMNVRGAKYDGCVQMHTPHRLGALVDQNFYKSFLDAASGELVGGHEHADGAGNTHMCVFKFYLVHRNKANAELLQIVDERGQALRSEKRKVTADDEEMRLNQAGVYDIDLEDTEADMTATDGYGSMHDIRHLQREFMLSLRLVCVECEEPPDEQPAAAAPEVMVDDDDDDDDFADELMSETLEAGSHTFDMGAQASDTEAFMQSLEGRAAAQQRTRVSSRIDEAAEPETRIAAEEGGQGFPDEQLKLTLEQAARLVGKLRAPQFQQRVNSHTIRLLCPRAFMFYAIDAGGE